MRNPLLVAACLCAAFFAGGALTFAAETADLSKIERKIATEPEYNAQAPLYGLAVFGPTAKTRVWLVMDQSNAEADVYDVLYADLNGNGDLTESGERFMAESADESCRRFSLPDFTDPVDGATHTKLKLRAERGERPIFMISVKWRGKLDFGGGYAPEGGAGYMQFAESAADAPIVWLNGDGPFRFLPWNSSELSTVGTSYFKVFIGQDGVGRNSFAAFQCYALPEDEPVLATLIYRTADGEEKKLDYKLKERC